MIATSIEITCRPPHHRMIIKILGEGGGGGGVTVPCLHKIRIRTFLNPDSISYFNFYYFKTAYFSYTFR